VEIELTTDPEVFASRAAAFLAERLERNVLATLLVNLRDWSKEFELEQIFATGTDEASNEIVAAALRTPPWPLLATGFEDPEDAQTLIDAWLDFDPEVNGISADPATACAIADAWTVRTNRTVTLKLAEAMHTLTQVTPPTRPAPGRLRQATSADRPTLIEWERGFAAEALDGDIEDAPERVDRRLAAGHHYIWEDGEPVSMLAHTPAVSGTARIGPVYTPPEHRNRGYATSAVATLSQQLLDSIAHRCMLYTDLANPTSNRIYASIGYQRCGAWEVLDFSPPARDDDARTDDDA
jgi:uncharacterized protein